MIAAMTFVEIVGAVGVVAAAGVGLVTLFEKVNGGFGRWIRRQVVEATRHHLGPNGDTPPLWRRVEKIEHHLGLGERDAA